MTKLVEHLKTIATNKVASGSSVVSQVEMRGIQKVVQL